MILGLSCFFNFWGCLGVFLNITENIGKNDEKLNLIKSEHFDEST